MFDIRHDLGYSPAMFSQPKQFEERDEEYLAFIRSLSCAVCNHPSPSIAHHHPPVGHSSTSLKTSDYRALPLCGHKCHPLVHNMGRHSFWGDQEAVEDVITRLNIRFFFLAPPL